MPRVHRLPVWLFMSVMLSAFIAWAAPALADCADPPAPEGRLIYNSTYKVAQFCDGTNWISMAGGGAGGNDPRIGTLAAGKWCTSDGSTIACTDDAPVTVAGSDKQVIFNDGGSALAGAAQLVWNKASNRLGVGTTSPLFRFHVAHNAASYTAHIENTASGASASGLLLTTADTGGSSYPLWVRGSGGTVTGLLVRSDGRVGIGTTSPRSIFHAVAEGGAYLVATAYRSDNAYGGGLQMERARGTIAAPAIVQDGDITGFLYFRGHDGADFQHSAGISGQIKGTPGAGSMPGSLSFWTTPVGSVNLQRRVTVDDAGNVAIGSGMPQSLLHLASPVPTLRFTDTDTGALHTFSGNSSGGSFFIDVDVGNNFPESALIFRNNGVNQVMISKAGHVGIGTTAPGERLDFGSCGGANRCNLKFGSWSYLGTGLAGYPYLGFGILWDGAQWNTTHSSVPGIILHTGFGSLSFSTAPANTSGATLSTLMTIRRETGNVGIGTDNPASRLHLVGGNMGYRALELSNTLANNTNKGAIIAGSRKTNSLTPFTALGVWDTGSTRQVYIGGGGWGAHPDATEITFYTSSSYDEVSGGTPNERMRITSGGSLVITGTAYKPGGGDWAASSDIRLKDVDGVYAPGLEAVSALRPVRYHYKKDNPRREPSDRPFVGLVAQEVQKVLPEAVSMRDDGYYDLDATPISYAVINAIRELKAAHDNQSARIESLEAELQALKNAAGR